MPSLGADMDAGTLVEWHVAAGDAVKRGDIVAVVETDKGLVDIEIWESGVVDALLVAPGSKVPVGTLLATTRTDGARAQAAQPPVLPPPPRPPLRPMASPAAKQLARERGVDLAAVHGTGPHGAITRADVEHVTPSPAPPPEKAEARRERVEEVETPREPRPAVLDATAMRRAIAASMARSKREIPHYYLSADIDLSRSTAWLEAENARRPVEERLLLAALLLKATALAARAVPEVNGFFVDGVFRPSSAVHLGVAVSLRQGGLVAPAIHDVDARTVVEVQASLRDLVGRVRTGRLRSSEMSDPTLTVTNLGEQGVAAVFGVIYPPQVALVGLGKPLERPWASGGMLGVRPVVTATISADHRVSDGHRGALFLAALDGWMQKPEAL